MTWPVWDRNRRQEPPAKEICDTTNTFFDAVSEGVERREVGRLPGHGDGSVRHGSRPSERQFGKAIERDIDAVLYDFKGTEIFIVEGIRPVWVFLVQGGVLPLGRVRGLEELTDSHRRVVTGLGLVP